MEVADTAQKGFRVGVAGVFIFVLAAGLTRPTQRAEANDKGLRR